MFSTLDLEDLKKAYKLAGKSSDFYTTIGVHPWKAEVPFMRKDNDDKTSKETIFNNYFEEMKEILRSPWKNKIIAIGECGLDYKANVDKGT